MTARRRAYSCRIRRTCRSSSPLASSSVTASWTGPDTRSPRSAAAAVRTGRRSRRATSQPAPSAGVRVLLVVPR